MGSVQEVLGSLLFLLSALSDDARSVRKVAFVTITALHQWLKEQTSEGTNELRRVVVVQLLEVRETSCIEGV